MEFNSKHKKALSLPVQKDWRDFTVLIVEDNAFCYLYLEFMLKDKVKRIDRAINGKEAVSLVLKNRYDLILMDLKMPIMNGIEATSQIKQQFPDIPIIAQTADATYQGKERALQAGCDGYIVKPIKKVDLMEMIKSILS